MGKDSGQRIFGETVGNYEHKHTDLQTFVRAWFRDDDYILIQGKPAPNREHQNSAQVFTAVKASDLANNSDEIYEVAKGDRRDIYFRFTPLADPGKVTIHSPGTGNAGQPLGLWCDLDIKSGGFSSQKHAQDWLDTLPVKPTLIVRNGTSGGIHAYWRIQDNDLPRLTSEHFKAWWQFLQDSAPTKNNGERVSIDYLISPSHPARLPGMIYWPKTSEAKYGTVALAGGSGAPVALDDVLRASEDSYRAYRQRVSATKSANRRVERELERKFPSKLKLVVLEYQINELMSWDDILSPAGWTYLRTESSGARQWARPGVRRKSAVTDFSHDNGQMSVVMSLLSGSEETGLLDLKQAGIPLTKFRVLLRLRYADDAQELVKQYKNLSISQEVTNV